MESFVGELKGIPVALALAPDGRLFFTMLFGPNNGKAMVVDTGPSTVIRNPKTFFDFEAAGFPIGKTRDWGAHGIATRIEGKDLWIYMTYIHAGTTGPDGDDPARPRVIKVRDNQGIGSDPKVIIDSFPPCRLDNHCGGNIHFGPDGLMYVSVAGLSWDAEGMKWPNEIIAAQQEIKSGPRSGYGAIYRFNPDGTPASGNPFPENPGLYAYGFHNAWDFTFSPDQRWLLASEAGEASPFNGGVDEINLVELGKNYGWPLYSGPNKLVEGGKLFPLGLREYPWWVGPETDRHPGYSDPVLTFSAPSLTTSLPTPVGLLIYSGKKFPDWAGRLLVCENTTFTEGTGVAPYPGAVSMWDIQETKGGLAFLFRGYIPTRCSVDIEEGPDGSIYSTSQEGVIYNLTN
ncbi:MAG: PQQ-dependent sugar dehydrogenase [Chloroflexi bacterium]|nr:PQQ-dependent sugar dehydrogenase [Chloroflexota bacterium]